MQFVLEAMKRAAKRFHVLRLIGGAHNGFRFPSEDAFKKPEEEAHRPHVAMERLFGEDFDGRSLFGHADGTSILPNDQRTPQL